MKKISWVKALAAIMSVCGFIAGCGRPGDESAFVQACLTGPGQHTTEALCKCGARNASATLSASQFQAMVLDMQGKASEAERLLGDLTFDQRAEFGMKQFQVLGECLKGSEQH